MAEGVLQAWGMLAATFKKSASGFYETGNTKATVTIKRPRTKGGLLISQREEENIPRKTSAFAIMCSDCWLRAGVMAAKPHFP